MFRKKTDLSDQSRGGDKRKKEKEVQQSLLRIGMFLVKDWSQLIVSYFIQLLGKSRGQSESF